MQYTPKLGEKICEEIADGRSISSICRDDGMPAKRTVMYWLGRYPEFRAMHDAARIVQADAIFDEVLDIADDGRNDYMEREDGTKQFSTENVQRSRLRCDQRKWVLARMNPKKYSEYTRTDVEMKATVAAAGIDLTQLSDEQLSNLRELVGAATRRNQSGDAAAIEAADIQLLP